VATHRLPILGNETPDSGVPLDRVSNQITSATAPSVGNLLCYVLADGGTDEGIYGSFEIPQNYVGTPKVRGKVILDGTPGAGDDLGFFFRKRAVADNESADGTFDAEQTFQSTDIGSTGSNHANEDIFEFEITLTGGDYAVGDTVYFYFGIDASGTTFAGNCLLADLLFQYADA
jgi:hypothetical protein